MEDNQKQNNIAPNPAPSVPPTDIPLPTYKPPRNSKMTAVIAGGIIAIVMIIGLSIFLTALNKQTSQTKSSEETSKEDKKDNSYLTENEKQTLVKKILAEVKDAAIDIDETTNTNEDANTNDVVNATYSVQDVYDSDNPLYFVSGAKVPTLTNKSFGFVITATDQPELTSQIEENAKAKLKKLGFTVYKDAGEDTAGGYGWYNSDDKIICTPLRNNLTTLSLSCAHTSWIPTEKVALVNSLATAYMKKEGELPLYINASTDKIERSPYEPYQKIIATLPDSVGLFYRSGANAEWVYFMSTQATIPCNKYYTETGAQHAFQGDACLDVDGEISKVKENVTEKDKKDEESSN